MRSTAGPAFALFSLVLLPWTVYLGYSLPSGEVACWVSQPGWEVRAVVRPVSRMSRPSSSSAAPS
jgi:hypothetical protein